MAQNDALSAKQPIDQPQEDGRNRLPGESTLWFHRYCLYRDLGHKRSLRAAVAKEQASLHVVAEPRKASKSLKKQTGTAVDVLISPAPDPEKRAHVPGSWKAAYKQWRWAERAQAFDRYLISTMGEMELERLGASYANKYKRILMLDIMLKGVIANINARIKKGMDYDTYLAFVKQVQSLTAQIERETRGTDEAAMKACIAAYDRATIGEIEKAYHESNQEDRRVEIKLS